jgi:hypothetical protein
MPRRNEHSQEAISELRDRSTMRVSFWGWKNMLVHSLSLARTLKPAIGISAGTVLPAHCSVAWTA